MRFRKLRIAWSVMCGIACVLLIVLWVRSYWWVDTKATPPATFVSREGAIDVRSRQDEVQAPQQPKIRWAYSAWKIESWSRQQYRGRQTKPIVRRYWYFHVSTTALIVTFPHWCASLVLATSGAFPWIHPLRYRFSLRTLLIATTLVAVVLGMVVYAANYAEF